MTHLSRRALLAAAPLAVVAVALAGCNHAEDVSPVLTVSTVTTDAQLIATGLQSMVTALQGVQGIPAETLAHVQGYVTKIAADANALAAATAGTSVASVQDIATLVSNVAGAVGKMVPAGSTAAIVIAAAQALVPVIMAQVGLLAAPATGAASRMSPDEARGHLRAGA